MAPRIGFTLQALRELQPAACDSDVRLVWKDGDRMNIGIVQPSVPRDDWHRYFIQNLRISSARELRLLGLQMIEHANNLEKDEEPFTTVIP